MEIDYDPAKAAANPLNHDGVTFDEATAVLLDPCALTRKDTDADEPRYVTLGRGAKGTILVVGWTTRGDCIRLISAWKANPLQRRRYEHQF